MYAAVNLQPVLARELLRTELAMERLFSSVDPLVDLQLVTVDELLVAEMAMIQLFPRVQPLVKLQGVPSRKLLWAGVALKLLHWWLRFRYKVSNNFRGIVVVVKNRRRWCRCGGCWWWRRWFLANGWTSLWRFLDRWCVHSIVSGRLEVTVLCELLPIKVRVEQLLICVHQAMGLQIVALHELVAIDLGMEWFFPHMGHPVGGHGGGHGRKLWFSGNVAMDTWFVLWNRFHGVSHTQKNSYLLLAFTDVF